MTKETLDNFFDNYADGKAADIWDLFIGKMEDRMVGYKTALCDLLRKAGAKRVLDLACGIGPDSVMLVEEGFQVTSVDASDKMLKHAWKTRWDRRKEPGFDDWVILEANWLTLLEDLEEHLGDGFDAAICLGNSFSHVLDPDGDQRNQRLAVTNFKKCLKPGGLLIMDHRNYDDYKEGCLDPAKSIYYHIKGKTNVETEFVTDNGRLLYLQYNYTFEQQDTGDESVGNYKRPLKTDFSFRLFPHNLRSFSQMIEECFDVDSKHLIFGDYKPLAENCSPGYFVHTITRGF